MFSLIDMREIQFLPSWCTLNKFRVPPPSTDGKSQSYENRVPTLALTNVKDKYEY